MKASELRIGNFILDRNKEVEIIGILRGGFYFENSDLKLQLNVGDRFSPITLTEEWLVKFGFIKRGKGATLYLTDQIYWNGFLRIENHYTDKCKSVHQLQNLYFALTGEELQVKE